jgi:hypothetical protein
VPLAYDEMNGNEPPQIIPPFDLERPKDKRMCSPLNSVICPVLWVHVFFFSFFFWYTNPSGKKMQIYKNANSRVRQALAQKRASRSSRDTGGVVPMSSSFPFHPSRRFGGLGR